MFAKCLQKGGGRIILGKFIKILPFILLFLGGSCSPSEVPREEVYSLPVYLEGQPAPAVGPRYSPDGNQIAFSISNPDGYGIAVVQSNGGEARVLNASGFNLHPSWSPDGSQITFISNRPEGWNVYTIPSQGGKAKQITYTSGLKYGPDWSPDGLNIVYTSTEDGNGGIWVVPALGGKPKLLTSDPGDEWSPRWSSDGKWIYFVTDWASTGSTNIWKIPGQGGDPVQVTNFIADEITPSPSPDGKKVAYITDSEGLWVLDLETEVPNNISTRQGFNDIISWTPDGKHIAGALNSGASRFKKINIETKQQTLIKSDFTVNHPDVSPDGENITFWKLDNKGNGDLWTMELGSGGLIQKTTHVAADMFPSWSPDGKWIAFSSKRNNAGRGDIWVLSTNNEEARRVTSLGNVRYPRWCTTGNIIVFQSAQSSDGNDHIWRVSIDGETIQQLTFGNLEIEPDCFMDQLIFVGEVNGTGEIFIGQLDGTNKKQLTFDQAFARKPRWSPDGTQIAFISSKGGAMEIYILDLKTGETNQLTTDGGDKSGHSWAPDGKSIYYSYSESQWGIWIFPVPE